MALEITHLDTEEVAGILDGIIPFRVTRKTDGLSARIAGWKRIQPENQPSTKQSMRSAAYEMLARYRESQRSQLQEG